MKLLFVALTLSALSPSWVFADTTAVQMCTRLMLESVLDRSDWSRVGANDGQLSVVFVPGSAPELAVVKGYDPHTKTWTMISGGKQKSVSLSVRPVRIQSQQHLDRILAYLQEFEAPAEQGLFRQLRRDARIKSATKRVSLPDTLRSRLDAHPQTRDWYTYSAEVSDEVVDPIFKDIARMRGGTTGEDLFLGGGSDQVQFLLSGTGKNQAAKQIHPNQTQIEMNVLSLSGADQTRVFRPNDYFEVVPQGYADRVGSRGKINVSVNMESKIDLDTMIKNATDPSRPHLTQGHMAGMGNITVPLKNQAIIQIPKDGGRVRIYFRTKSDLEDYMNKIIRLPDEAHLNRSVWLKQFDADQREIMTINMLEYSGIVSARGKARGWRVSDRSREFLKDMAQGLSSRAQQEVEARIRKLASADARVTESELKQVFSDFGLKGER